VALQRRIIFIAVATKTFNHHTSAEEHQQHESNPVIPLQHELAGEHPQTPADKRRQRFDSAKDETGTQGFGKFRFMESGTFADRGGKCVHGHAKSQKDRSGDIHKSVQTGDIHMTHHCPQ